jgi:hypothetical protein
MNRPLAWALLAAGVVLLIFGFQSYHSVSSGVSRVFTGAPTNRAILLLVGGAIASIAGVVGISRR